jgi:hypothetical protein
MLENFTIMIFIITELISGLMAKLLVDNGIKIKCMVLERQFGQMEDNILDNLLIIRGMVMDISFGQMEGSIMVIINNYSFRGVEEWQAAWKWGLY